MSDRAACVSVLVGFQIFALKNVQLLLWLFRVPCILAVCYYNMGDMGYRGVAMEIFMICLCTDLILARMLVALVVTEKSFPAFQCKALNELMSW